MKPTIKWLLLKCDWANRWLAPICNGAAILLGTLWQNNFIALKPKYPDWQGLFRYIEVYVPPLFIVFFVLGAAFSSLGLLTRRSISNLENALKQEQEKSALISNNIEDLVRGLLLKLSENIKFEKGEPSRLTIYVHNTRVQTH